jgi:copper chaperone CopZ
MKKRLSKWRLLLAVGLLFNVSIFVFAGSINSTIAHSSNKQGSADTANLHRLDFRIEGKSCPSCLLSIQRKLNSLPGVKEAVVMLKRPFGASVIYQVNEIKQDEILAIVKDREPNIRLLEINDSNIKTVPSPVIPPFVPMQASH